MLLSVFFFRNSLQFKKVSLPLQPQTRNNGAIAQLVEHQLPKLRVAGSNPVCRSKENSDSQVVGYQNSLF